jgi:hypothetical protein
MLVIKTVMTLDADGGTCSQAENPPSAILRRPLSESSENYVTSPPSEEQTGPQDGACEEKGEEATNSRSRGEGRRSLAVAVGGMVGHR